LARHAAIPEGSGMVEQERILQEISRLEAQIATLKMLLLRVSRERTARLPHLASSETRTG
jgi:hypothetical protein